MSLSYSHDHLGSVWYHSEPSEGPLFPKPVTGQELFLAVSYSKPALGWKIHPTRSTDGQDEIFNLLLENQESSGSHHAIVGSHYGNTGCVVVKGRIQNQKGFWLKINCSQKKLLNFENWSTGKLSKIGHHFRK